MRYYYFLILLLLLPVSLPAQRYSSRLNKQEPEHIRIARQYVGQSEARPNRSAVIDSMNRFTGAPLGSPYCMSFVSWIINKSNVKSPRPRLALAQALKTKDSFSAIDVIMGRQKVLCGDILTWQKGKTAQGHAGFASEDWNGTKGKSIQANTSGNRENREGDGIYEKTAKIEPLNYFRIKRITRVKYK